MTRTAVIYVLVNSLVLTFERTQSAPFFSIWTGVKREREFSHFFGSDCSHLRFGKISCPHTRKYATYTLLFDLDWGKERIRVLFLRSFMFWETLSSLHIRMSVSTQFFTFWDKCLKSGSVVFSYMYFQSCTIRSLPFLTRQENP